MSYNMEYGYFESNSINDFSGDVQEYREGREVEWTEPGLKITRFRLLTDSYCPVYDVSYCWGILPSGEKVHVDLPFHQLNKRKWKSEVIAYAKRDGVFAKGIGIFDPLVVSLLR